METGVLTVQQNDRADWLQRRRRVIGASEIGAVIGVNPYMSKADVWLSKVRGVQVEDNEHMRAGRLLEPVILEMFTEDTGKAVIPNAVLYTVEGRPIGATPDAFIAGEFAIVQCKNTSRMIDPDATVNYAHYAQVQYELGVCGEEYRTAYLAYLCQGWKLVVIEIDRNDELIEQLFTEAERFWAAHVATGIPPTEDLHAGDAMQLWPEHTPGLSIEATPAVAELFSRFVAARDKRKEWADVEDALAEEIKVVLKDAEELTIAGVPALTWKAAKPSIVLDAKALKAAEPDVWNRYAVERAGSRRLLVKGVAS